MRESKRGTCVPLDLPHSDCATNNHVGHARMEVGRINAGAVLDDTHEPKLVGPFGDCLRVKFLFSEGNNCWGVIIVGVRFLLINYGVLVHFGSPFSLLT